MKNINVNILWNKTNYWKYIILMNNNILDELMFHYISKTISYVAFSCDIWQHSDLFRSRHEFAQNQLFFSFVYLQ